MKQAHLTRIKTGLLLGLLAIFSVFFLPNLLFDMLCSVLISLAFLEWLFLISVREMLSKFSLLILFWIIVFGMLHVPEKTFYLACAWWLLASICIFIPLSSLKFLKNRFLQFSIASLVLGPLWVSVVLLHETDRLLLFYPIMLVCFADTAAYFVGSHWGKTKLMPKVSPKKTVEGLVGGMLVGSVMGMSVIIFHSGFDRSVLFKWLILGIFLILISVIGDLFESLMKRLFDMKDSGSFLPGHGGFLDRLDSLAAAYPVFLLILLLAHIH